MKRFEGLIVDDQFWKTIVQIFQMDDIIGKVDLQENCTCDDLNSKEYDGIKLFVANSKGSAENLINDKNKKFDFFVFDADLSIQHVGEEAAVGYGFELWKVVQDEYQYRGIKKPYIIVYTRSIKVIGVVGALLDNPRADPKIIRFGDEKKPSELSATGAQRDKLISMIRTHIHQCARRIIRQENANLDKKKINQLISTCLSEVEE